jgi:ABC-2 type transport system ATP-binding protein
MIEVDRLEKMYGERRALCRISFQVARGEIVGFLGPNGAGKTTTMKILAGLIPATSGRATVAGFDIVDQSLDVRRRIGYLPEHPPLYREMIVRDFLSFVCDLRAVPRTKKSASVNRAIELCGLSDVSRRIVGRLSKGYRQRVGLAQAIIHDPEILILDEPTVGLDPGQIAEIRGLIKGFGGQKTVILSTHILPEVKMTCQRVLIINKGSIVAEDSIDNLTRMTEAKQTITISVVRDGENVDSVLSSVGGVLDVIRSPEGHGTYHVTVDESFSGREHLAAAIVEAGFGLTEMKVSSASLEEVFLDLVTQEKGVAA